MYYVLYRVLSCWARMQEEHISCTYVLCIIPCVNLLSPYAGGAYILYLCIIPCVNLLGPYAGGAYTLYLCIVYYTVCYLTGIFYAVVGQISMLFIDNEMSVFCGPYPLASSQ